jgi:hypothetical protein
VTEDRIQAVTDGDVIAFREAEPSPSIQTNAGDFSGAL